MTVHGYDLFTCDILARNTRGASIYIKGKYQARQVAHETASNVAYNVSVWATVNGHMANRLLAGVTNRIGSPHLGSLT